MFPGHCNIPGHSGIDQKHKKAFIRIRDHLDTSRFTYENKGERPALEPSSRKEVHLPKWLKNSAVLLFILLAIGSASGIGWLVWNVSDTYVASVPKIQPDQPDMNAYRILTNSGGRNLCAYLDQSAKGTYDRDYLFFAKAEYQRALKILPADSWATS